jgi:hypothetical protein
MRLAAALAAILMIAAAPAPSLTLERTIPLPKALGRIDHMAFDARRGRLIVAELGAGAVEVVDLASGGSAGRIAGLKEPQGVAVLAGTDQIAVATGGDGKVRFYHAADLSPAGEVALGDDADNLRVDPRNGDLVVGYGSGALAVIDAHQTVVRRVALPAHPESFQLQGGRAYVNLPNANRIAAVDLDADKVTATWPNPAAMANFPMALDTDGGLLFSVYRLPGRVAAFRIDQGKAEQVLPTCGDADDVFFDQRRSRVYVVCGQGQVQSFAKGAGGLTSVDMTPTPPGARTGLFLPALDRLVVAARAEGGRPAHLLILKPGDAP